MQQRNPLIAVIATLLVGFPVLAQPVQPKPLPPGSGLSVDRIDYDQASRSVTVTFRNSGTLEITAFGWSLNLRRPGFGVLTHNETVDLLPALISEDIKVQFAGLAREPSFQPGQAYSLKWIAPSDWGEFTPDHLTAEVNGAVVYSDCTALGDNETIEQVFARRRGDVADDMDTVTLVRHVSRDRKGEAQLRAVRDDLERQSGARTPGHSQQRAWLMKQVLSAYEHAGWEGVDQLSQVYEARAQAMARQCYRKEHKQ